MSSHDSALLLRADLDVAVLDRLEIERGARIAKRLGGARKSKARVAAHVRRTKRNSVPRKNLGSVAWSTSPPMRAMLPTIWKQVTVP